MEPIEEILETVRAIRRSQLEARETQLQAVRRQRQWLMFGGLFFAIILIAYVIWAYVLIAHTK